MNTSADTIYIDVMRTLCSTNRQIDCIHSQQVWVSGYKPQWNNEMTLIFMKVLVMLKCGRSLDIYVY